MTSDATSDEEDKSTQTLEEICENTRAIRRVVNKILDKMDEYQEQKEQDYDPDNISWQDLYHNDEVYT